MGFSEILLDTRRGVMEAGAVSIGTAGSAVGGRSVRGCRQP